MSDLLWCACKKYGPVHVWEPGESCNPTRVEPPTPVPSEVAETTAGEREVEALITAAADALMASRLTWSTHADQCVEWQREFWTAVASIILTPALLDQVRREEGERIAQAIATSVSPGFGMHRDGTEDSPAMAYVEGLGDATAIARAASVGRGEGP